MQDSGINRLVLSYQRDFSQMIIFERELGLMDESGAIEGFTAIERQEDAKTWYELIVAVENQDDPYTVTTARQSPRRWVHLNTLFNFIKEKCPRFLKHQSGEGLPSLSLIFEVKPTERKE